MIRMMCRYGSPFPFSLFSSPYLNSLNLLFISYHPLLPVISSTDLSVRGSKLMLMPHQCCTTPPPAAAPNTCKVDSIAGTCISKPACSSSGGKSTKGSCPDDPDDILVRFTPFSYLLPNTSLPTFTPPHPLCPPKPSLATTHRPCPGDRDRG